MNDKRKVLYIGGFELPDKNAAAHRVVNIAKALKSKEYEVAFISANADLLPGDIKETHYCGFKCYEYYCKSNISYRTDISYIKKLIKLIDPYAIIAYNYPSIALLKLHRYCSLKGIRVIADVTEWDYGQNYLKRLDTYLRMNWIHPKLDGVIAISKYIYDYYKNKTRTVQVPPLVDIKDDKWINNNPKLNDSITKFVYAGSPSVQKERLDLIIDAIKDVQTKYDVRMIVIGLTEKQFRVMYGYKNSLKQYISFMGRINHQDTLSEVANSDWSIIIRDRNLKVDAGFPTKLVESITCGTPVIANRFSNISDYLNEDNSIIVENTNDIKKAIIQACDTKKVFDRTVFDYRNYSEKLCLFMTYD